MEEIPIPSQNALFPKLPFFHKGQRLTNEQMNLLSGASKGDNAISSILNAVRVISSNFSYNPEDYEVTATNGVLNKNFGRTKFSIPSESVSIIGIDMMSEFSNGKYSIKFNPGVVILDYMSYVFTGVTVPIPLNINSGVFVFAFSETYSDEDYNQFLNLDTDKIVKTKYNTKKTFQMKLFHIPVYSMPLDKFSATGNPVDKVYNSIDDLIEDVAPKESFPICGYTNRENVFIIRNLFKNMPLFPPPDYITTTDILGKWIELGDSFSLVIENGDRVLKSLSQLNLSQILPVNSVVRLNRLLYRKVVKIIDNYSVQLDRGYYVPNVEVSRELLVRMPVEKAISLETFINGEVAKYELGEIKYFYAPSTSKNWFRLSSLTRKLYKKNYPDFVPYLYNYSVVTPGDYTETNLSSGVYTNWVEKFEIVRMTRNKNTVTIYFTPNQINKRVLQALSDDHSTRSYIDPYPFTPRTITIGENPISMEVFKSFPNLSSSEIKNIQRTASWEYFLKWIYLEPGTYPIQSIDLLNSSISILVETHNALLTAKYEISNASRLEYKSDLLPEIQYGDFPTFYLENIFIGANSPIPLNLKGSLIQFFPHRLPTEFSSGQNSISTIKDSKIVNGVIETQPTPPDWIPIDNRVVRRVNSASVSTVYLVNPNKYRLSFIEKDYEVMHFAVPGNGYRSTVLSDGTMTNGSYEGVVGAINGWEKYVVPGYAHIFSGNYIEE